MIYGDWDLIFKFERLLVFVFNVEEVSIDCGYWI